MTGCVSIIVCKEWYCILLNVHEQKHIYIYMNLSLSLYIYICYICLFFVYKYIHTLDSHMAPYGACGVVQSEARSCEVSPNVR